MISTEIDYVEGTRKLLQGLKPNKFIDDDVQTSFFFNIELILYLNL